jgi:hypothetical protein
LQRNQDEGTTAQLFNVYAYDKRVVLVRESAQEAALLYGRWLRVFIVILLGAFFAILYLGPSTPVEASDSARKVEPPTPPRSQVRPKEPDQTVPFKTALPRRAAGSTYLQLSAVRRQSAERMADDLRKKNFEGIASEIDGKPGLFRVLVGPVTDTGILRLRADLERAGFPGNAAIRRTSAESTPPKPNSAITLSAPNTKEETSGRPVAGQTSLGPSAASPSSAADEGNRPVAAQAYLEFSATSSQTAEIIAGALHEKGFEAIASETDDPPGSFHVLIGPVDNTSIDQLRADLERAGFHGSAAILRLSK